MLNFQITSQQEYERAYRKSVANPETFWSDIASTFLWRNKWKNTLKWDFVGPEVKWFDGATLNMTENCLDRHLPHRAAQPAIIWEPNNPDEAIRTLTYEDLHQEVCRFAATLTQAGVTKGDRVCIYMPMVPEIAIAMLACARIGAVHSVVFAGFSARALQDRINDAEAKVLLTADGSFRGSKTIDLKSIADEALENTPSIQKAIVLQRTKQKVHMTEGRDFWWHDLNNHNNMQEAVTVSAEDMLFVLYTSGSTGKPKGVVHTTGGYMVYTAYTFVNVFQYQEGETYFCTADAGWITGHSYMVYGPLLAGATSLFFEGVPTWPDAGRLWQIVEKHEVNILYTAPTAIRALMAYGKGFPAKYNMQSLRVLGSVGEPINAEAWHWYNNHIGHNHCPIADTWWQTETGGIMISSLAGITPQKPTFATLPLPGIQPVLVDNHGNELTDMVAEGNLCIKFPWPGMLRTTYGDHKRCYQTYFSVYQGMYFTGDGCRRDAEGHYRILGRVDDVINVSGHRMSTAEIENAIDEHPQITEAAVAGYPHDIKGQGLFAYVVLEPEARQRPESKLRQEVLSYVTKHIGAIAKPEYIVFVDGLPKTRSGKIMRRILRKIAEGSTDSLGDISTLLNPEIVEHISRKVSEEKAMV